MYKYSSLHPVLRIFSTGARPTAAIRQAILRRSPFRPSFRPASMQSSPPATAPTNAAHNRKYADNEFTPGYGYKPHLASLQDVPPSFLRHYSVPDACQILVLPDGRHLSFAEYGSRAADAHPFIFVHGIPDSRVGACLLPSDRALAEKLNIRWIGIDRPGMGLSTLHPGRTVLGWIDDLECLIAYLGLETYRVFGASGGTGYALAAALRLPSERLRSVGIGFGAGPWQAGLKGASLANRIALNVWERYPGAVEWFFDRYIASAVAREDPSEIEKVVRKSANWGPKQDRELMGREDMVQGLVRIYREVYRQGNSKGAIEDGNLANKHWGFELEDIKYPGIRFWYGKKDTNTPPEMGRYMAARLPGAILKEYEGKTHFTVWDHVEEMLTDMLKDN